jgi:hypothetical protein
MPNDSLRLIVTATLAALVLGGATFLAFTGKLDSAAAVALYGTAIGAVGTGVRGTPVANGHVHSIDNGSTTTGPNATNGH